MVLRTLMKEVILSHKKKTSPSETGATRRCEYKYVTRSSNESITDITI